MMLGLTGFPCASHPTRNAELPGSLAKVPGIAHRPGNIVSWAVLEVGI